MPIRRFIHRLVTLFRSTRAERELAREVQAHLQLLEDEFVAKGMSRDDARYAAKRAFGGVEQAKEHQRDARSFRWLAGWPMDLKLGARMLLKTPGLTVIGVAALAVAIGAGAAYLELTQDLLNPTLNVEGSDRVVGVKLWNAERRVPETLPTEELARWRANTTTLQELGASRPVRRHLTTADGRTEAVRGVEINASGFRLFPAAPLHGRVLTDADERLDADPVMVIGHDLWTSRFNGDPNVVGTVVRLGSSDVTIAGVMPQGFAFPVNHNLWIPLKQSGTAWEIFGRLKDGASSAAVQAELQRMVESAAPRAPASTLRPAVRVAPYLDLMFDDERGTFEIKVIRAMNIIFIMLLGICGANVATLVFARTAMRESEITVRTALGASRGRISAQLFAEALVLCLLSAVAGLFAARLVGQWGESLFMQGIGPMPFWWNSGLSYPTILYALALAVFAALIVGLVPAMKATGRHLQGRLREASSGTSTMKFGGMWTAVIVTQAALTVVFVSMVVSLAYTGYHRRSGAGVSYAREQLLTARVEMDSSDATASAEAQAAAYDATLRAVADRLANEPGVASVGYSTSLPGTIWEQFTFELQSPDAQAHADARKKTDVLWCEGARVGDGFFETANIPLVAGRGFSSAEIRQGAPVAIVDETFVRHVLGERSPLGVTLRGGPSDDNPQPGPWLQIIGVARDASLKPRNGPEDGVVYRPAAPGQPLRLLVRTPTDASPMTQRVYAAARSVHPEVRLVDLKSIAQVAEDEALPERIFLRSFIVIAAIALLLATAGIYALISFTLARRTREIGIRVALGAAPRSIITGVFARAFVQIGLGVAAGTLPGLVAMGSIAGDSGAMRQSTAIMATLGVGAFVILVALLSCTAPLRRALRIQPMQALRSD